MGGPTLIAKLILVVTMAAQAILGGAGTLHQEQAAAFEGYYLHVDESGQPSIWQETNGRLGLQTHLAVFGGGPLRVEIPPDNRVLL